MDQCYKTFYRGKFLPIHGNTVIVLYKHYFLCNYCGMAVNLPQYFNPRKSRYHRCIYITLAPGLAKIHLQTHRASKSAVYFERVNTPFG
jgi:hypothetical protein